MRRLLAMLLLLAAALAGGPTVAGDPAAAQLPATVGGEQHAISAESPGPGDPRLGLVYDGLRRASVDGFCGGAFESLLDAGGAPWMKQVLCTHGPDPAPEGVDVRENREPEPAAELASPSGATAQQAGAVPCYGSGSDGYRVQLIYARGSGSADRFGSYAASFNSWAGRVDRVVNDSAAETGGTRHVRFVTDSACNPIVERVTLSAGAMSTFSTMVTELHSLGYSRTDRKYLVWADTNVYCGISELYDDDSPDATPGRNYNNGNPTIQGVIGRVDNGCWGQANLVEAHELLHLLGGVQKTAPHATSNYHCTDESDRLCYADASAPKLQQACPVQHEALYDCNHDDYFSTAPVPGSYLSNHWNTANSAFLSPQAPAAPPPPPTPPSTVAPPTTPPPTTLPPTTAPPPPPTTAPPTTATTVGPPPATTTTTGPQRGGGPPSAPQALTATQPVVGSGVQLSWQGSARGRPSGYRIYRGTSMQSQTLLATVPPSGGYHDAGAVGTLYFYRVAAVNGSGEGPSSALTGMIGKTAAAAGEVREDVDRRLVVSNTQLRSPWARRWA